MSNTSPKVCKHTLVQGHSRAALRERTIFGQVNEVRRQTVRQCLGI